MDPPSLISIVVEFRPLILSAIPRIIALLKNSDENFRRVGIDAVSNLSDHGKRVNLSGLTLLMSILAEFRPFIEPTIPEILKLLNDPHQSVRMMAANSLSKLAAHGKNQFIGLFTVTFAHQCCTGT